MQLFFRLLSDDANQSIIYSSLHLQTGSDNVQTLEMFYPGVQCRRAPGHDVRISRTFSPALQNVQKLSPSPIDLILSFRPPSPPPLMISEVFIMPNWHIDAWGDFSLCSMSGRLLELLGASIQLAICSKSPCSIAVSSWPYLQYAISSSPPLQLSRKVVRRTRVRTRSEHSSQSAHTLHYVITHPGTIAERNVG
jgi:hypothetical protein